MLDVGMLLRTARLRAGLTQVELDRLAGYSGAYVTKIECNAHCPNFHVLEDIVNSMGMELSVKIVRRRQSKNLQANKSPH